MGELSAGDLENLTQAMHDTREKLTGLTSTLSWCFSRGAHSYEHLILSTKVTRSIDLAS
jgi:hypothetical protein